MRVTLIAIGRLRAGPLAEAFADYVGRLKAGRWKLELVELEERRKVEGAELMAREATLLLDAIPRGAFAIALDPRGKAATSELFAAQLGQLRDAARDVAFLIGGADGFDERVRKSADRLLSLGVMTWPHMLVRVMLAEQLFRAQSILSGHPYHRA
jgi:23S rRNA (pseudouridine1915-N3)-methyltransferase